MNDISKSKQFNLIKFGVRIFRNLHFKSKASLISLAFLIPIFLLTGLYVTAKKEDIEVASKEKQGLEFVKQVQLATKLARLYRHLNMQEQTNASALSETKSKLDEQIIELKKSNEKFGVLFDTNESMKNVEQFYQVVAPTSDGMLKVFASHSKFNRALGELLTQVADGSGLTLDPEIDTYYLMDASILSMPRLLDVTSKMQSLASVVVRSGKNIEIATQELSQEEGLIDFLQTWSTSSIANVIKKQPSFQENLDMSKANLQLKKLRDMVSSDINVISVEKAKKIEQDGDIVIALYEEIQKQAIQNLDELLTARIDKLQTSLYLALGFVIFFLLLALYMFSSFYFSMKAGFRGLKKHLSQMTKGNLTELISPKGSDETSELMIDMLEMQTSLINIVRAVREGSEEIKNNSIQVASGASDMSLRTTETLNRLQSTSAAMVEISTTVESTAENAKQATQLAKDNAKLATTGGEIIGQMVSTMEEIQNSSHKISDIIGVIDSIAFQTNILALNAAVEAARAGESGRGFAVVASEVRSLAHRSAEAAKEIKNLINSSVDKVKAGTIIANNAGVTMTKIVGSADGISHLLADISVGASEQSIGVKDVEKVIQELDNFTQENAVLVEQTSASSDLLMEEAENSLNEVNRFSLSGDIKYL